MSWVERDSKASPWNLITPVHRFLSFIPWFSLKLIGLSSRLRRSLEHLEFIHFAQWTIVRARDLPPGENGRRERWKRTYILFASNFNERWDTYIDAFSRVIPTGLDMIWGASVGYPWARNETSLRGYAWAKTYPTDYYYVAYPGASIADVLAAGRVETALAKFRGRAGALEGEQFEQAWRDFLRQIQCDLGGVGSRAAVEKRERAARAQAATHEAAS